jgi:lipopolysaccharide export system protein LptA
MSADDARRLNIFEGDVVGHQGQHPPHRGEADRAPGRRRASRSPPPPASRRSSASARIPKPGEKEGIWVEGEALRIELDDKNQKIELFDKARVNRGGDEVAGDYIFVDQRADFYQVSSGKGGEKAGAGQSRDPVQAAAAQ